MAVVRPDEEKFEQIYRPELIFFCSTCVSLDDCHGLDGFCTDCIKNALEKPWLTPPKKT